MRADGDTAKISNIYIMELSQQSSQSSAVRLSVCPFSNLKHIQADECLDLDLIACADSIYFVNRISVF